MAASVGSATTGENIASAAERVNSLCGEAREVSLFFKKFYLFYLFIYFIVGGNKLQVADIFFFPSLHKIKGGFLLILCYHGDTWFPLNLTLSQTLS